MYISMCLSRRCGSLRRRSIMDPHHGLEAVEATNFSSLSFVAEPLDEVLVDDTVRCCKKARTWEMK